MSRQTAIQTCNANDIQVNSTSPQNVSVQQRENEGWSYAPAIDVLETQNEYTIFCDAPGIIADQIQLTYENGVLSLHGPVRQRMSEQMNFLRQEYGVGDFDRTIPMGRLAEFIDGDRISAEYHNGVLHVHMPKLVKAQGRRIEVKSA